jgi:hypothetical protein
MSPGKRRRLAADTRLSVAVSLGLVVTGLVAPAHAAGARIPLDQGISPKIDGVLKEWTAPMAPLASKLSGATGGADLAAAVALATDETNLYVALDVTDDKLVRTKSLAETEDHARLTIVFPGEGGAPSTTVELLLFAGDPGNVAGAVKRRGGAELTGSSLVEAPRAKGGGYAFEAKIPWTSLPEAAKTRVGLRGAVRYLDNDGKGIEGVVATADEGAADTLPRLPIEAEISFEDVFAKEKHLSGAPTLDQVVDVAGDGVRERVVVWDRWVAVLGSHYREGKQFLFADLGAERAMLDGLSLRDLTGDGKPELVFRRKEGTKDKYREALVVGGLGGEAFLTLFTHEVAVQTEKGSVFDEVKLADKELTVSVGGAKGVDGASWTEATQTSWEPVLLPWGSFKSRTFGWDGTGFKKVREEAQTPGTTKKPSEGSSPAVAEPPAPRPPTADELLDSVLGLYRKDRKLAPTDKPRFDLATNVAEGSENERILVFGRELVVFGKGFLGGTSYVSLAVGVAEKDVLGVSTRDLDGDGRAEILLRGVQRLPAPKELGAPPKAELVREVLFVYQVQPASKRIARVFAAETGISLGDRRVASTVAFVPSEKAGLDLVLGPGRATNFDSKTWPYKQDNAPVSGIEPLRLPWTEGTTRYKWNGTTFAH